MEQPKKPTPQELLEHTPIPANFPACLAQECRAEEKCLYGIVAKQVTEGQEVIIALNPIRVMPAKGEKCPHYLSSDPVRIAWGFQNALDELSKNNYSACTAQLIDRTSKSRFYRMRRGEVPLTPAEQEMVGTILKKFGYPRPEVIFDRYDYQILWQR